MRAITMKGLWAMAMLAAASEVGTGGGTAFTPRKTFAADGVVGLGGTTTKQVAQQDGAMETGTTFTGATDVVADQPRVTATVQK